MDVRPILSALCRHKTASALIVLASIAVARRLSRGESAEQILESITPDEIENAGKQKPSKPKSNGHNGDKGRFFH